MPELTIDLGEDGRLNLRGPIKNKLLCLGLLELGKEALLEYHRTNATDAPRVQPASPADFLALAVGKQS